MVRAKTRFVQTLTASPNVTAAARAAGLSRSYAYELREQDADFAHDWDDAIGAAVDHLEAVAFQRASEMSDVLLIFLLKSLRPERYQETARYEHSGPNGSAIRVGLFSFDAMAAQIAERSESDRQ